MKIYLVTLVCLLTACGGVNQADVGKWDTVSCGSNKGWDACMNVAVKSCPKGFALRNQEEDMMTQKRAMQFSCK